MRLHHLQLGLVLAELDPGDVIGIGKGDHRLAEPVTQLPEQHRRREREPQVPGQERHHLGTGLQDRHVSVEIDPVQALDIQRHMPVEHVIYRQDTRHDDHLPQPLLAAMMRSPALTRHTNHAARRSEAEPHCYSSRSPRSCPAWARDAIWAIASCGPWLAGVHVVNLAE
jgi:hypothetical protein